MLFKLALSIVPVALLSVALSAQGPPPPPPPPPPLPPPPVPPGNPITPAKVNLGKTLFWDEQLSSTRTVACGTCHIPRNGGSDPRTPLAGAGAVHPGLDQAFGTADDVHGSLGVIGNLADGTYKKTPLFELLAQATPRKAPSMINAAFAPRLFWDGRALPQLVDPILGGVVLLNGAALESQSLGPPVSDVEMAHAGRTWVDVIARVAASAPLALAADVPAPLAAWIGARTYPELFNEAFGTPAVTGPRVAMAIASYERTLISNQAPIDSFFAGNPAALTPLEQQGLAVFNGPGHCNVCHPAPFFTNQGFFNVGVRPIAEDAGFGAITGLAADQGKFKAPSLRNVALRAPLFHNGGMATVADVVEFYDRGGDFHVNQAPIIQPLNLTPQQKTALVAFLTNALTDPRVPLEQPPFDRPTLYSESSRVPASFGAGGAGSGGATPRAVAVSPPMLGNPQFAFGVADGLGGAPAVLAYDVAPAAPGTSLFGAPLWLGATPSMQGLFAGSLADVGAGEGFASIAIPVPATPSLAGVDLFLQWLVLDPGAPGGLASSDGVSLRLFAPRPAP